jgi:hypothetical protein
VPVVSMVQVPIVEIVHVTHMLHRAMPAIGPVNMRVLLFVHRMRSCRRHL